MRVVGVRRLLVLVGLPGSGKTAFRLRHPEWAVVSRDDIRRTIFHRDFDLDYEDTVERIFAATLVEAVDSPAPVVCVDNTNLTRVERRALIEVACLSGREPVAHVMPLLPLDVLYARKLRQLEALTRESGDLVVGGFPRERYEETYRRYEDVREDEGFVRVVREAEFSFPKPTLPHAPRPRRPRRELVPAPSELAPLPLFV